MTFGIHPNFDPIRLSGHAIFHVRVTTSTVFKRIFPRILVE